MAAAHVFLLFLQRKKYLFFLAVKDSEKERK